MRWNVPVQPSKGDKRVVSKFAWKPLQIEQKKIWFERYWIVETFGNREWTWAGRYLWEKKPKLTSPKKKSPGKHWTSV